MHRCWNSCCRPFGRSQICFLLQNHQKFGTNIDHNAMMLAWKVAWWKLDRLHSSIFKIILKKKRNWENRNLEFQSRKSRIGQTFISFPMQMTSIGDVFVICSKWSNSSFQLMAFKCSSSVLPANFSGNSIWNGGVWLNFSIFSDLRKFLVFIFDWQDDSWFWRG